MHICSSLPDLCGVHASRVILRIILISCIFNAVHALYVKLSTTRLLRYSFCIFDSPPRDSEVTRTAKVAGNANTRGTRFGMCMHKLVEALSACCP